MLGRLTAGARAAVALAEEEAVALGHDYIGTEHLLLGLAGTEDGVAGRVLASFGVTRDGLVGSVAGEVGRGCQARPRRLDSDALASIGIDLDEVRRRVEDAFGPGALERTRAGARALSASRPLVPRAQRALHMASKEARRSRRPYVGTEHLLLGLLRVRDCMAVALLHRRGFSGDEVRAAVLAELRR